MKILKQPLFILIVLVAITIYATSFFYVNIPFWVDHYINDLLCMPIVLSISLAVIRFIKSEKQLYVPFSIILILTLYFSLHFEWLMPQLSSRYTSDIIDVILYFSGAILFYRFQKQLF